MSPKPVIPEHLKRENEKQPDIVAFFRSLGAIVFITSERRVKTATPGMLDLYVLVPRNNRKGWFDTKLEGQKLTEEQLAFVALNEKCGVPCSYGGMREAVKFAVTLGLVRAVA